MKVRRTCMLLAIMFLCVFVAYAHEDRTEFCVSFRIGSTVIDPAFGNNADRIAEMKSFLDEIRCDSTLTIVKVAFCGAVSPEGNPQFNRKLSNGRLMALKEVVCREMSLPDTIIDYRDNYIPWDYLKSMVASSSIQKREEIIAILESGPEESEPAEGRQTDSRVKRLRSLDGGRVWRQMQVMFFKCMRNACAVFVTYKRGVGSAPAPQPLIEPVIAADSAVMVPDAVPPVPQPATEPAVMPDSVQTATTPQPVGQWQRNIHVKTNAIGWVLAVANAAVEIDICEHWSFTLPIYYSGVDYFASTIKFRTFSIQPEFRYWFAAKDLCNDGWFVGAHLGLAYYNFAFGGDYRYQDRGRETPAVGGGISVGYRMPFTRNNHWRVEFSIGAGAYRVQYDQFRNTSNPNNGVMTGSGKKTFWGIDQAAVTFIYTFNLNKRNR